MAGHSRWAQVKHKKAGSDAARGQTFAKLGRLISVAAREGGADPKTNAKLRTIIDQARAIGLPKENIERAIARAIGTTGAGGLETGEYEAYGPGGIALLIRTVTDNPNRTTNELKHLLAEGGGKLAAAGSVNWMFEQRAIFEFAVPAEKMEEAELALIDAGAEHTEVADGRIRAVVPHDRAGTFREDAALTGLAIVETQTAMVAKNTVATERGVAARVEGLVTALENHDDVTDVWTNVRNTQP